MKSGTRIEPMAKDDHVVITGLGLVTPVGRDSDSTVAALRAKVSRFRKIPDFMTRTGAQTAGGLVYGLTDGKMGNDRLLAMGTPALQEALFSAEEFSENLDFSSSHFLMCAPPVGHRSEAFETNGISSLLAEAQASEFGVFSEIDRGGQAVGIRALQKAVELLRESKTACVVGSIDCLVEYSSLKALEAARRLKTDHRSEGFIPGEAAAFLVLERQSCARRRGAPVLAEIVAPSIARESAAMASGQPLFGHGLAEAISGSFKISPPPVQGIICDLNGEYYRMKEWALAMGKAFENQPEVPELWHPAESVGDLGAASAIVFVAVAVKAIAQDYFSGPNVLVWASSDDGERGSVIIRPPPGAGNGGHL